MWRDAAFGVGYHWTGVENFESIQVSRDVPTLPSLRPNPNPKPAPTQTLGLREGRVGTSQK